MKIVKIPSLKTYSLMAVVAAGVSLSNVGLANAKSGFFSKPTPIVSNPNLFVNLSEKVVPSVVNISVEGVANAPNSHPSADEFRRHFEDFFGFQAPRGQRRFRMPQQKTSALGTGVVVKVDGKKAYVLTNHHVINGADKISVQFSKEVKKSPVKGKLIGKDPDLDVALIEVPITGKMKVKALNFGNSESLKVGEYVMAVGNPFGQGHSVSHGIISAKGRTAPIFGKYLQTDAPINPGNSGGPLVNLKGEIIGINNAILARAQGIGFAIPSNSIKAVLPQLMDQGFVERGYLGIYMGEVSSQVASFTGNKVKEGQPFIVSVEDGSPAEKAGLQTNDVILKFNGKEVKDPNELRLAVGSTEVNSKVSMVVLRDGKQKNLKVKIKKRKVS